MAGDALRTEARWHAVVRYRTGGDVLTVEMSLRELEDLHDRIDQGPHWDTVELIEIRRVNHFYSAKLTLEQAEELGSRPISELCGLEPIARPRVPLARQHDRHHAVASPPGDVRLSGAVARDPRNLNSTLKPLDVLKPPHHCAPLRKTVPKPRNHCSTHAQQTSATKSANRWGNRPAILWIAW